MSGVLILSARVGAGHVRAAQAIERAFVEMAADVPVHHVEILEYTNPLFRRLYSKAYVEVVNNLPELFAWYYNRHDQWAKNDSVKKAFDKLNTRSFTKLLEKNEPAITACTHPMPAEIVSWLISKGRLDTKLVVIVTDADLHAQWLCPNAAQYFVAIDEARVHLELVGVPADDITVSGIPIDPSFSRPTNSDEMREKHSLRRGATVILISAGGFGIGRINEILESLLTLKRPTQIVAICGRNEDLKAGLDRFANASTNDQVTIKVVGYTSEMDEYMAASDFVVGKPGGLTTSEALACNKIFVIVNPIPGQEERNADHLLEEGAAIRCNNLPVLAYKIENLLNNPDRIALMHQNIRRLARPRAAFDVVAKIRQMLGPSPVRHAL
jgi:processive 1,2-diacylglycerol beta-glucosyltransferase